MIVVAVYVSSKPDAQTIHESLEQFGPSGLAFPEVFPGDIRVTFHDPPGGISKAEFRSAIEAAVAEAPAPIAGEPQQSAEQRIEALEARLVALEAREESR